MVYLAWNSKLHTTVAIKEFFPRSIVNRGRDQKSISLYTGQSLDDFIYGKEQFLREARTLVKFDHANLVKVLDTFEENETAYIVMEYYEGVNLEEYVRSQPGGKLSLDAAIAIMIPIMDGLREVHNYDLVHRDVKPQNIYLSSKGWPILLDFGAARQAIRNQNQSNSVVLTEGFASYEQYSRKGAQGPHTDVYGCAATLYYLLTGIVPPSALDRLQKDDLVPLPELAAGISNQINQAINQAMAVMPEKRTPKIENFQAALLSERLKPKAPEQAAACRQISTCAKPDNRLTAAKPGPVQQFTAAAGNPNKQVLQEQPGKKYIIKISAALLAVIGLFMIGGVY